MLPITGLSGTQFSTLKSVGINDPGGPGKCNNTKTQRFLEPYDVRYEPNYVILLPFNIIINLNFQLESLIFYVQIQILLMHTDLDI
jgi:hypothetical protein